MAEATLMGSRYWRLFWAYAINTTGDEFYLLALPLVLLALGYDPSVVTFVFSAMMFATVLGGLALGYLVDRFPADVVMARSYFLSAAVLVASAGAIIAGADTSFTVVMVAGMLGVFAATSAAAVDAGIPDTLRDPTQITRGYSLVESARTTATFVGPALAGVAAKLQDLAGVLLLNATSFAVSAGIVWRRERRIRPDAKQSPGGRVAEIMAGSRIVLHDRALRRGVLLSLVANVTLGAEQPLFVARLVKDFSLEPYTASAVILTAGLTSLVALHVLLRSAPAIPPFTVMVAANLVTGLAAICIGIVENWLVSGLAYCFVAIAAITYNVYWRTFRQQVVSRDLLGRVSATCRSLAYLGTALGALVTGLVQAAGLTVPILFIIGGGLCVVGTLIVPGAVQVGLAQRSGSAPTR